MRNCIFVLLLLTTVLLQAVAAGGSIDLSDATIVTRPGDLISTERMAATVVLEEIEARTGIRLETSTEWPARGVVIAVSASPVPAQRKRTPPPGIGGAASQPEGYRLIAQQPDVV